MLGEGDGRFLAAFLRINPAAEVDYVDGSGRMLALAQRRAADVAGRPERVRFHRADALTWLRENEPGAYDLVCTHFFLDCFTQNELAALTAAIDRHTAAWARWIVSDFRYPTGRLTATAGRLLISFLYGFFRLSTALRVRRLPEHAGVLDRLGFKRVERRLAVGGLLVSECWERL